MSETPEETAPGDEGTEATPPPVSDPPSEEPPTDTGGEPIDPFAPGQGQNELETLVFTAIGAASTCWENPIGAGVFDSTRAAQIGNDLLVELRRLGAQG